MNRPPMTKEAPQFTVSTRCIGRTDLAKQVRNYSFASVAQQVLTTEGKSKSSQRTFNEDLSAEYDHRFDQDKKKENLQVWLDNLQHRLDEACGRRQSGADISPPDPNVDPASKGSKNTNGKGRWKSVVNLSQNGVESATENGGVDQAADKDSKKETLASLCAKLMQKKVPKSTEAEENSSDGARPKTNQVPKTKTSRKKKETGAADENGLLVRQTSSSNLGKSGKYIDSRGRWKSAVDLSESTVDFLIDADYLDKLQGKMQRQSLFSLYERLAKRKVKGEDLNPSENPKPKGNEGPKKKNAAKKKDRTGTLLDKSGSSNV